MEEGLLAEINGILNSEFTQKNYINSPEVLREVLRKNRTSLKKDLWEFTTTAWTEENMDLLINILKVMSKEELKEFTISWRHPGLKNSYAFMKKCLENDIDFSYDFISDDTLIDDEMLEGFVKGKKQIPNYVDGFFYKSENLERLMKFGGEEHWEYLVWFKSTTWTSENIDRMVQIIKNSEDLSLIQKLPNGLTRSEEGLQRVLQEDLERFWSYIHQFSANVWNDENIEIVIEALKQNNKLSLNQNMQSGLKHKKIFLKRCLEENLSINYMFFSKDEVIDDVNLGLMIERGINIPNYMWGFFSKVQNLERVLKFKEGYRYIKNFTSSKVWTEENINLLIQYVHKNGVENRDKPEAMLWYSLFPTKELRGNPELLRACIESESITVLREFEDEELWTEDNMHDILEYIRRYNENREKNSQPALEWEYFPKIFYKKPEVLKVALETDSEAVIRRYLSNYRAKEAWTEENKKLYSEKLEKRKAIYINLLEEYGINIKLSDKEIFVMFGDESINTKGIKYLFQNGYANVLNKMREQGKIAEGIFNENELKTLDYCGELDQEDRMQREFTKMFCKYIGTKEENIDAEKIGEIFAKIKNAISACSHLNIESRKDANILNIYIKYLEENMEDIETLKIDLSFDIIKRIEYSNSSELAAFTEQIANGVLQTEEPIQTIEEIEEIFVQNKLPTVGKIWEVFIKLHPDLVGFNFAKTSKVSPVLANNESITKRKSIIFSDLIRVAIGSNNKSLNEYLDFIERGSQLVEQVFEQNEMPDPKSEEGQLLMQFTENLITLYRSSIKSKLQKNNIRKEDNLIERLKKLKRLFTPVNSTQELTFADSIVRMYCGYAGFKSLKEIRQYQKEKLKERESAHKKSAEIPFRLEDGDFIKGIGDIKYLANILENGSLAKEFLGDSATSDATPLDTDCSRILEEGTSIEETMKKTRANSYGPIWIVIKGDERFNITRDDSKNVLTTQNPKNKLEAFSTMGNGHYGIRTGFASSDIDCFIANSHYDRIALELAIKGMYIPVWDKEGNLKFSHEQYLELRSKMQGLSYYGMTEYEFSEELDIAEIKDIEESLDENQRQVTEKKQILYAAFERAFPEYAIADKMSPDLSPGRIEILDTGSTGRGTNVIGDGDFDFIVRIDKEILLDPEKYDKLKQTFANALGKQSTSDKFRFEGISMPELEESVDVDITFISRTNKMEYSTEMCVRDRLETIRKIDETKYRKVVANIIFAKQFMKENKCYKPRHAGKNPQGGLGGVGIENWILQNGGSFVQACRSFLGCAKGKTLEEFKKEYMIWDFGANHMAKNTGPHDNFVYNMDERGFKAMVEAIAQFLEQQKEGQISRQNALDELHSKNAELAELEGDAVKLTQELNQYEQVQGQNIDE